MEQRQKYLKVYSDYPKRNSVRSVVRDTVLRAVSPLKRDTAEPFVRLFYCHYVFDDQIEEFERKILFLKSRGRFATDDQILDIINGVKPITENTFHISFDDGFRNIITNALPLLVKHQVPSTFFVPTAIVGADPDTVRDYCLKTTNYPRIIEMASWDDLKMASEHGMSIASHTRTHTRFSKMSGDLERMEDEIGGSKVELERSLGKPCRHISWPYGAMSDADETSLEFVRNAGYASCFGAYRGMVTPGETSSFSIPRHHFEPQWPHPHFTYFAKGGAERV
jgi:peptidoglycan/xylan/chitin deacetylase (PgdA/CDA1 family)